jgi:hypothetical protein
MHEESRETLIRDLVGLLEVGRDKLDMLVITPRRTSHGLIVMVEAAKLRLAYPQAGWQDIGRVWRFWLCGLRNRLSPRLERWGGELVHRVTLGSDPPRASQWIDEFFAAVYNTSGPFALDFTRQGWGPPESRGAA